MILFRLFASFLIGILVQQSALPLALIGVPLFFDCLASRLRFYRLGLLSLACILISAWGYHRSLMAQPLPLLHDAAQLAPHRCLSLEGSVTDVPQEHSVGRRRSMRFTLTASKALTPDTQICDEGLREVLHSIQSRVVQGQVRVTGINTGWVPQPGDCVRVFGSLERPPSHRGPGQFNYAEHLARSRIFSLMTAIGPSSLQRVNQACVEGNAVWITMMKLRQALGFNLENAFGKESQSAEAFKALLLGLRADLSDDLWQILMRTGTTHIISISGLHMSVLSMVIYAVFLCAARSQKKAALAAVIVVLGYTILAGASVPVVRSGLMTASALMAITFERKLNLGALLAAVGFFQLAVDPWAIQSLSFQFSYLSVAALIASTRLHRLNACLDFFTTTLVVLAATMPLALYHFQIVSWSSILANIWAIPFFNIALVCGFGLLIVQGVPVLGEVLAMAGEFFLNTGLSGIELLARWRMGWAIAPSPPIWKILLYYGLGFLAMTALTKSLKGRFLAAGRFVLFGVWILSGALFWLELHDPEDWSLTILPDQQDTWLHLRTHADHWILGIGASRNGNQVRYRLMPYLRSQGIRQLEGVIVNLQSSGAVDAIADLKENLTIKSIWSRPPYKPAMDSGHASLGQKQWIPIARERLYSAGLFKFAFAGKPSAMDWLLVKAPDDKRVYLLQDEETGALRRLCQEIRDYESKKITVLMTHKAYRTLTSECEDRLRHVEWHPLERESPVLRTIPDQGPHGSRCKLAFEPIIKSL